MDFIKQTIDKNKDRYIFELMEWLKIPSVSADPKFEAGVLEAANFLAKQLRSISLSNVELLPTKGFPVVYAEKIIDKDLPTILVYGHYDVQPADPYELWNSPP
ncbi:MAG TPA: peptidase dimerization domain protein, partial [Chitinophagales bacterium]|nr:peptidase dimerization domain protein [Chitinophagales bacterium]